ncbi:MAG: type I-C CRISPR-associated protein Cas7/Csd2 [Tissierellia bacterium]|nr:type I-C CRISPR-associated protein Cas7/Csd2 [Tissierellia bacterium]
MKMINNKYDFLVILSANRANPNGDPLNGNRPREDNNGFGEISDVCLKRKIRNRLIDMGEEIFVQSDEKRVDEYKSLSERAAATLKGKEKDRDEYAKAACEKWLDVRAFGQVFAFKKRGDVAEVSVGVRGPVSIHPAFSVEPIEIEDLQITKSVNSEPADKKSSDTMGMKHRVNFGLYVTKGSINVQLAEKTGLTDEDAKKIHQALITLFENDASAARPEGSMVVEKVYWWKHNNKMGQYPSVKVHNSVKITPKAEGQIANSIEDYEIEYEPLEGLELDLYEI